MTPEEVRLKILFLLEEHETSGSAEYVDDTTLADAIGVPVEELQRQLDILAAQGLTTPANTFGVKSVRISPAGTLAVERQRQAFFHSWRPIGFKTTKP